jgi:hypothetical protein
MKVFHFVYTKVNPEESPWKKADFHTVFYPLGLLTKADLGEIERRIYVPPVEHLDTKEVVFYKEIKGEQYLVLLQTRNLPEERDMFGRGGIFICHGFIFPPEVWKHAPNPSALFELVNEYVFIDRKQALSSSLVDRETGDTILIEVPEEKLKDFSFTTPPAIEAETEWRLVILLNRLTRAPEGGPRVVLRGEPAKVAALMNKIFPYIPLPIRLKLSWDTDFDSGSLTFYPFQVVGYTRERPRGGESIEIDLETMMAQAGHEFFTPESPYERWLNYCRKEIRSVEDIQKAYNLSLLLEAGTSLKEEEVISDRACFISTNKAIIQDVFLKRIKDRLGDAIGSHIYFALGPEDMLELLIEDFPPEKLVGIVERIIFTRRLTHGTLKEGLPDFLLKTKSKRMALIQKLWRGESITSTELQSLDKEDALEFVRYMVLTDWAYKKWLLGILRENKEIFEHLLSSYETRRVMEEILTRLIEQNRDFKGIVKLILKGISYLKKEFSLLREGLDMMRVLEQCLKDGIWTDEEMEKILQWAGKRKPDVKEFPYLKGFLYPKEGIPYVVMKDRDARARLLRCLVKLHGYGYREIEQLGFQGQELSAIKQETERGGWKERLKRVTKGILSLFERRSRR